MNKTPNETDVVVGTRVRVRRKQLGLSQEKLGEKVGITFQQIQKYEKGTNRIGASRLHAMAGALGVSVSYFFPDEGERDPEGSPGEAFDLLSTPGAFDLLRDFAQIEDGAVRKSLSNMARTLARAGLRRTPRQARQN